MHATGLDAALNTFFNQLHNTLQQEQAKKAELEAISDHRERLTTAIRSTIATLDPPQRKHWHSKLRRMLGKDDTLRARQREIHGTNRTRTIRHWLRNDAPPEFHNADLLEVLRQSGDKSATTMSAPPWAAWRPTGLSKRQAMAGTGSITTTRLWRGTDQ